MNWLTWIIATVVALFALGVRAADDEPAPRGKHVATSEETSEIIETAPKLPEYKPPFPDREELFQPPNFKGLTKSQRDEVRMEVSLKGFAEVDGIKALLTLNGQMVSLAVGENHSGVEVVAIQPPNVTLQRGRVRWTETLFAGVPSRNARSRPVEAEVPAAPTPTPEAN